MPISTDTFLATQPTVENRTSWVCKGDDRRHDDRGIPRPGPDESQSTCTLSAEKMFFNDFSNWMPLGSAMFDPGDAHNVPISEEWEETIVDRGLLGRRYPQLLPLWEIFRLKIVRLRQRRHRLHDQKVTVRFYILPEDVGQRFVLRVGSKPRKCLKSLMMLLDTSFESWEGRNDSTDPTQQVVQQLEKESLFYMFNTLPSPSPDPDRAACPVARAAMISLLSVEVMRGLKTALYSYQKRSAAEMVRRETSPSRTLDPRLDSMEGPTGMSYYYDKMSGILLCGRREYEEARGGILAETMGLGKTMICLATILATKGHWPQIPPSYSVGLNPVRPKVASLLQMTAAAIGREQIPWRTYFQNLSEAGEHLANCTTALEENLGSYFIPPLPTRGRAQAAASEGQRIHLCTATLIIVPPNLVLQWRREITLHLKPGALKVLFIYRGEKLMPPLVELLSYDVILMSRKRFEQEFNINQPYPWPKKANGYPSTSNRIPDHFENGRYHTPLKDLHFLRIIVDEGHDFASTGGKNMATAALHSLHVERRWIVSGTPTTGLLGVEVGLATHETSEGEIAPRHESNQSALDARREVMHQAQERSDLEKLGSIVVDFLRLSPWANSKGDDPASWTKLITPLGEVHRKPTSLRKLLESLVVRHQIQAVEDDLQLPSLHNRVVYLEPSWHDKLSFNLFVLTLTANAVTSERVDQDYMFHPRNRAQLDHLIMNLRQSAFYWTSFSSEDISKTLEVCQEYLDKTSRLEDRELLLDAMLMGKKALRSSSWRAFADLHELGVYVDDFPEDASYAWSLVNETAEDTILLGATHLIEAQKYVDARRDSSEPTVGLDSLGLRMIWDRGDQKTFEEPKLTVRNTVSRQKPSLKPRHVQQAQDGAISGAANNFGNPEPLKSAMKTSLPSADSPLAKTKISGTASAKLSYLLDKVIALQQNEKILIFYEGDQIAYYIAQAFDLLSIEYRIYTRTLSTYKRNSYIDNFNESETTRVLLMNVRQAAHGLHIASASRVFFVNPVWQPNVEAQAIKRAHRIGQTRPVYVETLVLKDTIEDRMLKRRKKMTTEEHQTAKKSLVDDPIMGAIIKDARPIPLSKEEALDMGKQMARLETPQYLFSHFAKDASGIDNTDHDLDADPMKQRRKRKLVGFGADATEPPTSSETPLPAPRFGDPYPPGARDNQARPDLVNNQHDLAEPRPRKRVAFAIDDAESSQAEIPHSSLFG